MEIFKKFFSPFLLPVILTLGIVFTFVRIIALKDSSASLGIFFETIYYTCFTLFSMSIILLIIDFKKNKKSILLWIHLAIGAPLSIEALYNQAYDLSLDIIDTTTPSKYRAEKISDQNDFDFLSNKFEQLADSLIDVQVIGIEADSASRFFFGKTYNDRIDRKFAINLTPEIKGNKYLSFEVTNLYYSPGKDYFIGFLSNKNINRYAISKDNPEGFDYESNIFVGNRIDSTFSMIVLSQYTLSCVNFDRCEYHMVKNFIKGKRKTIFGFNINDIRIWKENDFADKLNSHAADLEKNIWSK